MKLYGALLNPQIMYYSTPMFKQIGVKNADVIAVAVGVAFSAAGLASVSHQTSSLANPSFPLLSLTLPLPPTHPFSLPTSLSLPLSLRFLSLKLLGGELLYCMDTEAWQSSLHYSLACSVFRCAYFFLPPLPLQDSSLPINWLLFLYSRMVSTATDLAQ